MDNKYNLNHRGLYQTTYGATIRLKKGEISV